MNIILYKGQSQYNVLRFFIDEMAAAFRKLGHNVTVIDLLEKDWPEKIKQALVKFNDGCDFVFAFNGMGMEINMDGRSLYDVINVPFVAALVDHPCMHIKRLDTKMNNLIVTCVDRAHLNFLSSYYPEEHIKFKVFLPHGGSNHNFSKEENSEEGFDEYLQKRTIPLLFTGNFKKIEKTWSAFSPAMVSLLDDIVDCILGNETIPLDKAYNYVLKQRGMELEYEMSQKIYSAMFHHIDLYVQDYLRQVCVETVAKAGIPLVLYGHNWDSWLKYKKYKSITYLDGSDYQHVLNELQKTKLFLNNATNFIAGSHERDFNAMLNGAICITQFNQYYNEEFVDGKDIVLYKFKEIESLPDKIAHLLEKPETAWQIAKAAKEKAEAKHTWFNRAERVLEIVQIYRDLKYLKS